MAESIRFEITAWEPIHLGMEEAKRKAEQLLGEGQAFRLVEAFEMEEAWIFSLAVADQLGISSGSKEDGIPIGIFVQDHRVVGLADSDAVHFFINAERRELISLAENFARIA